MITNGGVVTATEYAVTAQSTPNMSVQVAAGRAWIPGSQVSAVTGQAFTTQAAYFVLNDAPVTLTIAAADPTNPRLDLVYVAVQDAFYSGSLNQPVLGVVTGTPAASPQLPPTPTNGIGLGYAYVTANATSITSGNVVSFTGQNIRLRGGTYLCTSTTRPTSPAAGWEIYETDTNRAYFYTGSAWVGTADVPVLASISARDSYFSGKLRPGAQALVAGTLHTYGSDNAWHFILTGYATPTADANGYASFPHNAGQAPVSVVAVPASPQPTEAVADVISLLTGAGDTTNINIRVIRADTHAGLGGQANVYWTARF